MSDKRLITIASDNLTVEISPVGAEMQRVVCDGIDRLWCGDPAVWGRHAPLLFPIIGRLRDGYYAIDGKRVDAPRHGFCRDRLFDVVEHDNRSVTFSTCDDETTRAVYPFAFRLFVRYEVEDDTIRKTLRVENPGATPLPFEIGGHEAYATRLDPDETMADWSVRFGDAATPALDSIEMFAMDADGIFDLPKITVPLTNGRLAHTPEQLGIDTIVLENVPDCTATLESARSGHSVTVKFPGFPYLGIWTKPMGDDTRYLCIEPWSALPDAHFVPREFAEKPGVQMVEPDAACELSYSMTFR